jgi:hypothetical protein
MTRSREAQSTRPARAGAADAPRGRVPDFFVIGHPKSGTTALHGALRRHPQIYMPELKEPRYFAGDIYAHEDTARSGGAGLGRREYLDLFAAARPAQRAGEASPMYLASGTAAQEIAAFNPEARVIAVLREPASFLRSLHLQLVQTQDEDVNSLRHALALEDQRRRGARIPRSSQFHPQILMYSDHVRYVEQLRRYHAVLAPEQILVMVYDDFRLDNEAALATVLRFLEVDGRVPVEIPEANPTVRKRSVALDRLVRSVSLGRGPASGTVKSAVKAVTPRGLRRRVLKTAQHSFLHGRPGEPDPELMVELRRRFKPEVVALSEYLGRDLVTLWDCDTAL